jgi:TATA-box binding protein (TBP) (component of TFIID and TFIIIB)
MDDAFDRMFDLVAGGDSDSETDDNIENDDYNAELLAYENEIRQMEVPVVPVDIRPRMIEVAEFDPENNVLDPDVREEFKNECVFEETHIFSSPVSTTNTMEGYLSNVTFHERDLIQELIPDENLVLYRCNYGKLKFDGYTEPVKVRKTNRGRKKKEKKKKLRKKQGEGIDFNSQITFVVRSSLTPEVIDEIVPYGTKVYKFKIFRTGKLQLPGVHQYLIDDVITCTRKIVDVLNFHLHPAESDPAKISRVININPVMKNYKFIVKLPPGHIIDMETLRQILARERERQFGDAIPDDVHEGVPDHPSIFMLKYTRQDTKLSIKFSTPIYKKPKKKTRINIFMRGKINILGAFNAKVTKQICDYLHWIFETNYDDLVVPEGVVEVVAPPGPTWVENIEQPTDEEFETLIDEIINWLPPLPEMSHEDYNLAMKFIDDCYHEEMIIVNNCMLEYFRDTFVGALIDQPNTSVE